MKDKGNKETRSIYDNRYASGTMKNRVRQYIFVIRELTGRELKRTYARSKLGAVWSILNPLLTMIVMSLIFSYMFRRSIVNFPVYYLCGQVTYELFTRGTGSALTVLVDNKQMLIKVKIPMRVFVLSRVYTALVNYFYSLIAFIPILIVFQVRLGWSLLFLPVIVFLEVLLTLGVSYALSNWYVFFGDLKHLWRVFTMILMYLSAIFYPIDSLPDVLKHIVANNPVYLYIDCFRWILLEAVMPPTITIIKMVGWSIVIYLLGSLIAQKNRNKIMQRL